MAYFSSSLERGVAGRTYSYGEQLHILKKEIAKADAILVGAGSGLSTSAGYVYTGERFQKYFYDFVEQYHFLDMYTGGFYPFPTQEAFWGYWCRYIWINRYAPIPKPKVFQDLRALLRDKGYFVLTTNVDHCFQRTGFDKERLFYTQGDYGLFQSSRFSWGSVAKHKTYDNEAIIRKMLEAEGITIKKDNTLQMPSPGKLKMTIPTALIPFCPDEKNAAMTVNLRSDDKFVEDEGWNAAAKRYDAFMERNRGTKTLYLELGVGWNTPSIIKYNFWQSVADNPRAFYVCINAKDALCGETIVDRSLCIQEDIGKVLHDAVTF